MSNTNHVVSCLLAIACCSVFFVHPVHAFTANSLDIVVEKNGDATATFRFTLEGIVENAIPQSVLEDQLKKGLSTGPEPPDLISMDRSNAVLLLRKFADTSDVETGTEYRTESMDFKKAEVALQNSGLGGAVTADFTPDSVTVTFPDSYKKSFSNVDSLPAITHTVIDPTRTPRATAAPGGAITDGNPATGLAASGSMSVNSSPEGVKVYVDSQYIGDASSVFFGIAPGVHAVEFRKEDYDPVSRNVTVLAGKTTHVMVVLMYNPPATSDVSPSFPWPALLVVIIGLAVIAAGGYFWWSEREKKERGDQGDAGQKTIPGSAPAEKKAPGGNAEVKSSIVIRDITGTPAVHEKQKPATAPPTPARTSPPQHPVVRTTQIADVPGMPPLPKDDGGKKIARNPGVVKVSVLKDIPDEKPAEDKGGEQDG